MSLDHCDLPPVAPQYSSDRKPGVEYADYPDRFKCDCGRRWKVKLSLGTLTPTRRWWGRKYFPFPRMRHQ